MTESVSDSGSDVGSHMTIAEAVFQCLAKLDDCTKKTILKQDSWAENRLAEFNLWIEGVGALAGPKASLDARLEFQPHEKGFIVGQLALLELLLDECLALDTCKPSKTRELAIHDVDVALEQLATYSHVVRRAGTSNRLKKADSRFDHRSHQEFHLHLAAIVLVRPSVLDTLRSLDKSVAIDETELIIEKLDVVQKRLVDANLKRRNRFTYAQKHAEKLSGRVQGTDATEKRVKPNAAALAQAQVRDAAPTSEVAQAKIVATGPVKAIDKQPMSDTTFSALEANKLSPLSRSAALSQRSRTEISTTGSKITYPLPPLSAKQGRPFRCPCCCQTLPGMFANLQRWRKHIAEDVVPYVCVLQTCAQPDSMFVSKEAWLKHIDQDHGQPRIWQCVLCDPPRQFYDHQLFEDHVKMVHKGDIDDVVNFATACEVVAPPAVLSCPLCAWADAQEEGFDSSTLLDHIAEHLHSFALRSLPWPVDESLSTDIDEQKVAEDKVVAWYQRCAEFDHGIGDTLQLAEEEKLDQVETRSSIPAGPKGHIQHDIIEIVQNQITSELLNWRADQHPNSSLLREESRFFNIENYFAEDARTSTASNDESVGSRLSELGDTRKSSFPASIVHVRSFDMSEQEVKLQDTDDITDSSRQQLSEGSFSATMDKMKLTLPSSPSTNSTVRDLVIVCMTDLDDSASTFDPRAKAKMVEAYLVWLHTLSSEFAYLDFLIILDHCGSDVVIREVEKLNSGGKTLLRSEQNQMLVLIGPYNANRHAATFDMRQNILEKFSIAKKRQTEIKLDELCNLNGSQKDNGICWVRYGEIFGVERDVIRPILSSDRLPSYDSDDSVMLARKKRSTEVKMKVEQPIYSLKEHAEPVRSVAFSPNGQLLATASDDGTVKLWYTITAERIQTVQHRTGGVGAVAFSPNGQLLASTSATVLSIWSLRMERKPRKYCEHSVKLCTVAFSPDGQLLATSQNDGTIILWDTSSAVDMLRIEAVGKTEVNSPRSEQLDFNFTEVQRVNGHPFNRVSVAFSPDGRLLASSVYSGSIKLWNARNGMFVRVMRGHYRKIWSVAFSPDSQLLASGSDDRTIKLWNTSSDVELQTMEAHTAAVHSVTFSPDGQLLASGSIDGSIRLWDTSTWQTLRTLQGHAESVNALSFSLDGQLLASASDDQTVNVWGVDSTRKVHFPVDLTRSRPAPYTNLWTMSILMRLRLRIWLSGARRRLLMKRSPTGLGVNLKNTLQRWRRQVQWRTQMQWRRRDYNPIP